MRKLILGIFAVVCVQFAFVIYTALQSPLNVAVGPIFSGLMTDRIAPGLADTRESTIPADTKNDDPTDEPSRKSGSVQVFRSGNSETPERVQRSIERTSPAETRTSPPGDASDTPRLADPSDFETVVISYNRSPELLDCEKIENPRPKKRTYIAKAAPVVKKPWEWIKAIGSKLN